MRCRPKNDAISPSGIYSIKNNEIYFTDDTNIKYQKNKHLHGYGYVINTERDTEI